MVFTPLTPPSSLWESHVEVRGIYENENHLLSNLGEQEGSGNMKNFLARAEIEPGTFRPPLPHDVIIGLSLYLCSSKPF